VIDARARPPVLDFPITLAIAAAAIAVTAAALATGPSGTAARWFAADADRVAGGELHRLLTGPLLHVTWGHLIRDLALVAIPGIAYEAVLGRRWAIVVGLGLIAPAAAVLATGMPAYYGLSGLSHAVLAAVLVFELRHRRGAARVYVALLFAAGAIKLGYELVAGAATFPMDLGAGVVQVPLAHAVGAAVGIAVSASASGTR
jgi:membrane associated rhomboid family serine protease